RGARQCLVPQAKVLEAVHAAGGEHGRTAVVTRLCRWRIAAQGTGLHQQQALVPAFGCPRQRAGERAANHASADNHHIVVVICCHGRSLAAQRAAAIKASISATVRGSPLVSTSCPLRVTATSSSMRTPMPR